MFSALLQKMIFDKSEFKSYKKYLVKYQNIAVSYFLPQSP